jgi:hypothetical protein
MPSGEAHDVRLLNLFDKLGLTMANYWIKATPGDGCTETCKKSRSDLPALKPVQVSIWSEGNGNPFMVCSGGIDNRPGYQIDGFNTGSCIVPRGGEEVQVNVHYCLCTDEDQVTPVLD